MGFLANLNQRWLNMNGRFWGRQCARVMLWAYKVKWNQYKECRDDPAWIAGKALVTRIKWTQIDETTFTYEPIGDPVKLVPGYAAISSAIHAVIQIEYAYLLSIRKGMIISECAEMVRQAHRAADSYIANWKG
jgi:hypothetical protein